VESGSGGSNPFLELLAGRAVVVGVGNELRGDDGLGPALVGRLRTGHPGSCVEAGPSLENHVGTIARRRPERVLLVDAVHLGREPGAWEVLGPGDLERLGTSTHDIPLAMLCDFIAEASGAEVRVLGVQPASLRLGEPLSPGVERALGRLEELIGEALG
jgi:hydrogenase 3 maturation protease